MLHLSYWELKPFHGFFPIRKLQFWVLTPPSVAAPPPLWLAAVGPDLKNDIEHAEDEERQAGTVDQAEVAAALCETATTLRRFRRV